MILVVDARLLYEFLSKKNWILDMIYVPKFAKLAETRQSILQF